MAADANNMRALGIKSPAIDPVVAAVERNQAIARAETTVVEHDRRMAERRGNERRAEAARYSGGNRKNGKDRRQRVRRILTKWRSR